MISGALTPAAHAVSPPNGSQEVLNGVGADATFAVMSQISGDYTNDTANTDPDTAVTPPAKLDVGQTFHVPGDSHCAAFDYTVASPPPNGASAGISALVADSSGCVDYARSSRGRSGSDPASLDFYAFATDAVSWAAFADVSCPGQDSKPRGCAPKSLTQDQLKGIYLCTEPGGFPKFTDWSQVGGDPGPIVRYFTQTGSGTGSFFETKILGLTSAQQGVLDDTACSVRPIRIQQSHGDLVAPGDHPGAILPYSFGDYTAQTKNVIPDHRAGAVLGWIDDVKPSFGKIKKNAFLGVRYVYNVSKSTSPSLDAVLDLIGVDASGNGFICSGLEKKVLKKFGFVALPLAPAGPGLPDSYCRKNPPPL